MKRGEYRPLYCVLTDDPEFQALSRDAKLLFFVLKLELGASGIGVVYDAVIVHKSGIPFDGVADAYKELAEGDWIRRQANIIWIRNGLRYEPNISLGNSNHRTSVVNHLQGLPKLEIVNAFAEYYDLDPPFPDLSNGVPKQGVQQGVLDGITDQERGERREERGNGDNNTDLSKSGGTSDETSGEDEGEDPAKWMHEVWRDELGRGAGPDVSLTQKRRGKYRRLYKEQLADADDPRVAFRMILKCVQASDHHMSKRSYQMPESLFRNEDRRERWIHDTADWLRRGGGDGKRDARRRRLADQIESRRAAG